MNFYGFFKNDIKDKIIFYCQYSVFCLNWFNWPIQTVGKWKNFQVINRLFQFIQQI